MHQQPCVTAATLPQQGRTAPCGCGTCTLTDAQHAEHSQLPKCTQWPPSMRHLSDCKCPLHCRRMLCVHAVIVMVTLNARVAPSSVMSLYMFCTSTRICCICLCQCMLNAIRAHTLSSKHHLYFASPHQCALRCLTKYEAGLGDSLRWCNAGVWQQAGTHH